MRSQRYVAALYIAVVWTGLGDRDRAFQWLDQAYDEDCEYLVYLPTEPIADPLRGDPRFSQLLQKLGLTSRHRQVHPPPNIDRPESELPPKPLKSHTQQRAHACRSATSRDAALCRLREIASHARFRAHDPNTRNYRLGRDSRSHCRTARGSLTSPAAQRLDTCSQHEPNEASLATLRPPAKTAAQLRLP